MTIHFSMDKLGSNDGMHARPRGAHKMQHAQSKTADTIPLSAEH